MSPLPQRHSRLEPVGDILVSYSADQLPTDAIDTLASETRADVERGEMDVERGFVVLSWLTRIAIQKLRAVES
jgi:hypothetical protein